MKRSPGAMLGTEPFPARPRVTTPPAVAALENVKSVSTRSQRAETLFTFAYACIGTALHTRFGARGGPSTVAPPCRSREGAALLISLKRGGGRAVNPERNRPRTTVRARRAG